MDDLISRSALMKKAVKVTEYDEAGFAVNFKAVPVVDIISAPTVDAVEVVRCRDCVYRGRKQGIRYCLAWCSYNGIGDDGFCAYGKRREDLGCQDWLMRMLWKRE